MDELGLVGDLAIVVLAALLGGYLARALRLPTVLGYIAAGLAIGPNTPGFSGDIGAVQQIADLGVALLMFTLGIRFSFRELLAVRRLAAVGGLGQIGAMLLLGGALGAAIGLNAERAFMVGAVVSISSTMVALRLLEEQGEIGSAAGRVGVAFALVQDLAVVPLIVMVPVVAGDEGNVLLSLGLAAVKGIALLAGVTLVGVFVVPRILSRVTLTRSTELFLLTVVALALGTASISAWAGLSIAFGAFLAGLLVSESEYAHRTLAEVFPLREVFAVVFFVAVGMLIEPSAFVEHPELVFPIAALGVFGKLTLVGGIALVSGYALRASLTAAVALANMGEFSFVLATEALKEGIFDTETNGAILSAVLLSIAAGPLLLASREPVLRVIGSSRFYQDLIERSESHIVGGPSLANHAVICGFNEAARELMNALSLRGFRFLIVDEDPVTIRRLGTAGVPCILGDPALPRILEQCETDRARLLAVTLRDTAQAEAVLAAARQLNPKLDVIVLGGSQESHERLRTLGAAEVIHGEFEAGLEFVRHALHRFGVPSQEVQSFLARRRRDYHR